MANAINWFEIPTHDFDRAKKFYSEILASNIEEMDMGGFKMGMLPAGEGGIGGAIVKGEGCVPSENGTMVYLNAGADLAPILTRIEEAGGKVVMPKTMITEEIGYMATFTDTEGNRVALHSQG
jgi:predicted enzyme related to lactoylglutathione lyase